MAREAFLPKDELSRDSSSKRRDSTPIDIAEHRKPVPSDSKSYTVERDGQLFAGTHVLVDFWGASKLDDMDTVDRALRGAAAAAGATLLHIHLHKFSTNGGISGVAVLAESHISVHTWPELEFAAFDIFMCGACDPHDAVPTLERAFSPERVDLIEQMRGRHG